MDFQVRPECNDSFFGLPAWHNGLLKNAECEARISSFGDVTTVIVNVIQLGLRAVALVAFIMVIVSGIRYITSAGNPEAVKGAQKTLTYALLGLAVSLLATSLISIIIGRF